VTNTLVPVAHAYLPSSPRAEPCPVRTSGSIDYGTQMPSSVTANLLDDGVADTLGLVDAMSGAHTSVCIDASDRRRIAAARMNGTKQRRGILPVNLYKIFHMNGVRQDCSPHPASGESQHPVSIAAGAFASRTRAQRDLTQPPARRRLIQSQMGRFVLRGWPPPSSRRRARRSRPSTPPERRA
jgi:hypothetical protein